MSTMRVTRFVMIETGTYNDMFQRPFVSHIDGDIVNEFRDLSNNGMLTPAGIAGFAGKVITPSSTTAGAVSIANGWGERRFRFVLEFEMINNTIINREVLTGYTDYVGATIAGSVDPSLRMYFNSTVLLRSYQIDRGFGVTNQTAITDTSQIITKPQDMTQYTAFHKDQPRTIRPEDVVATMALGTMADMGGVDIYDNRNTLITDPKKSRRSNVMAGTYLSRIVKGLDTARTADETVYGGGDNSNLFEAARDNVRDPLIQRDKILAMINANTDYAVMGSVSYGAMARLFPDLDHNCSLIFRREMQQMHAVTNMPVPERGGDQSWGGSTLEQGMASVLGNAIPALMTDLMLSKISFSITNCTIDGRYATLVNDASSFASVASVQPYVDSFLQRLETEVMFDVTHGSSYEISIQVYVDVVGDSFFTIALNGGYPVSFTLPSFCDSLMTPLVTNALEDIQGLAYNIETLWNDHDQSRLGHTDGYQGAPSQMEPIYTPHVDIVDHNPGFTPDIATNYTPSQY